MRQLKLAITWGHEKVAKELIFEKKDYRFRVRLIEWLHILVISQDFIIAA